MADAFPQFESQDNVGSSKAFNVTATTTVQAVPAAAGNAISEALVNIEGSNVEISFDNQVSFFKVPKNAAFAWDLKGSPTQVFVKTSSGTAEVSLLLNFEDS